LQFNIKRWELRKKVANGAVRGRSFDRIRSLIDHVETTKAE
jgi:hypothetical protein